MDHEGFKIRLAEPTNGEPPIAKLVIAQTVHEGQLYTVSLVRSHFRNEGFAILERVVGLGVGITLDFAQHGEWKLKHDAGLDVSILALDFDDSGDCEQHAVLMDRLMAEAVKIGFADVYEPQSEWRSA